MIVASCRHFVILPNENLAMENVLFILNLHYQSLLCHLQIIMLQAFRIFIFGCLITIFNFGCLLPVVMSDSLFFSLSNIDIPCQLWNYIYHSTIIYMNHSVMALLPSNFASFYVSWFLFLMSLDRKSYVARWHHMIWLDLNQAPSH